MTPARRSWLAQAGSIARAGPDERQVARNPAPARREEVEAPAEVRQVRERRRWRSRGPRSRGARARAAGDRVPAHRPGLRGAPASPPIGIVIRAIVRRPGGAAGRARRGWRPAAPWPRLALETVRAAGTRAAAPASAVERHEADPRARVEARRRAGLPLAQAPRPAPGPASVRLPLLRHARPSPRPSRRHAALPHREAPAALAGQAAAGGGSPRAGAAGLVVPAPVRARAPPPRRTRAERRARPHRHASHAARGRPRARAGASGRRGGAGLGGGARRAEGQAALPRGRGRAGRRRRRRGSSSASATSCGRGGRHREPGDAEGLPGAGARLLPRGQAAGPVRHPARPRAGQRCASMLEAIRAHDPGTRLGEDPEELHQMRVAVRRLRAVMRAARPMFAPRARSMRSGKSWPGSERRSAARATST